jgi:long-chain acyl-CoA synthetase
MMKVVVSIDPLNGEAKGVLQAWGKVVGVQIMELFEGWSYWSWLPSSYSIAVEALGKKSPIDFIPPTPDQVATICYTSVCTQPFSWTSILKRA